ncbi:MAG: lipopolysaccharide assembly protein LapA domain-containing protein [Pseudoxanthomonas sp.]
MNIFRLIIALVFLGIGLLIGVLNTQPITLKLLLVDIQTSSGVAIILSLLAGLIIGGLIVLTALVLPLYTKLRRANKQAAATPLTTPTPPAPPVSGS